MRNFLSFALASLIIVSMFTVIASAKIDTNTIMGMWLFDEGEGDAAIDSSGKGNDGTLKGGIKWVKGQYGTALEFNGVDSYVNCGSDPSLNPKERMTIVCWAYYTTRDRWIHIVIRWDMSDPTERNVYHFAIRQGKLSVYFDDGMGNFNVDDTKDLPLEQWVHLAFTADSASKKVSIYVDGSKVGETPYAGAFNQSPLDTGIGAKLADGDFAAAYVFEGMIDEVAIFNVALTEEEIKKTMEGLEGVLAVEKGDKLASFWGIIKQSF